MVNYLNFEYFFFIIYYFISIIVKNYLLIKIVKVSSHFGLFSTHEGLNYDTDGNSSKDKTVNESNYKENYQPQLKINMKLNKLDENFDSKNLKNNSFNNDVI